MDLDYDSHLSVLSRIEILLRDDGSEHMQKALAQIKDALDMMRTKKAHYWKSGDIPRTWAIVFDAEEEIRIRRRTTMKAADVV